MNCLLGQFCREKGIDSFSEFRKPGRTELVELSQFLKKLNLTARVEVFGAQEFLFAGSLGDFKSRGRSVALNLDQSERAAMNRLRLDTARFFEHFR